MLVYRADILLEQLDHKLLGQPDRFILQPNLDARAAILGLVDQELGMGRFGQKIRHAFFLRDLARMCSL